MTGPPFDAKTLKDLWDTWNIRVLTILSLSLQSFLILFSPLRRPIGGKLLFTIPLWIAYLLADWIAIFVIGLILRAERSADILVFWAPFLLLHLGGPDTITSFSIGDNDFWIRHLLGLMLQVGSTVYVIIRSLPHNKLLLPTLLVLTAGIIKYAERNRALFLACFEHYGDEVTNDSFLKKTTNEANKNGGFKLLKELTPYGTIKNLLVGPLISHHRRNFCRKSFLSKEPKEVLGIMEFELSLLYEALHTKSPVVLCKRGYFFRIICIGCISGALLSFRLITKANRYHDELENSEIWLTYGLLIGAITLDFISIVMLSSSDYFNTANYGLGAIQNDTIMAWIRNRVIHRNRWSKRIPQYNFITYCVKACPGWLNKLVDFPLIRSFLKFIQGIRCLSLEVLKGQVWNYIFEQVKEKAKPADTVEKGKEICRRRGEGILNSHSNENIIWSVKNLDYMESLLTWHIATELCLRDKGHQSTSSSGNPEYREVSKLLSNYMFYLLQEETAMRAIPSSIGWKKVFNDTYEHMQCSYLQQGKKDVSERMISTKPGPKPHNSPRSVLYEAHKLFNDLKEPDNKGFPWELMSRVWVELMCYAAISCKPNVHAQQPSMGGQLITIVWLLMNHLGLGTQFATDERAVDDDERAVDDDELIITFS